MQTTHHSTDTNSGLAAKLIRGIRSIFGGSENGNDTLAANCAADIRRVSGLSHWVESLASLDQPERASMLLRAAGTFGSEFSAADLANTLSCMATDAGLFLAVSDALKKTTPRATQFAQAA